jgi:hypothetical protein
MQTPATTSEGEAVGGAVLDAHEDVGGSGVAEPGVVAGGPAGVAVDVGGIRRSMRYVLRDVASPLRLNREQGRPNARSSFHT